MPRPGGHATDIILIDGRIDGGAEFGAQVVAAVGAGFRGDAGAVLEQFLARDVEPVGGIGVAFNYVVGQMFGGEGGRGLLVGLLGGVGFGCWGGGIGGAFDYVVGQLFGCEGGRRPVIVFLDGDGFGYWGQWVWWLWKSLLI